MRTPFAKDLKPWTGAEEFAARDAVLAGLAHSLQQAAQTSPWPPAAAAGRGCAAAPAAVSWAFATLPSPAVSADIARPAAASPAR